MRDSRPADTAEAKLAARLADREPDALADVYERFGRVTFGFLLKTLGDRATAEDVHQQVYLEVWQRAPTYDPARSRFLNWVMTIARSRAIDQLRRRIPEPVGGSGEPAFEREPDAAVDEVDRLIERYRVAGLKDRTNEGTYITIVQPVAADRAADLFEQLPGLRRRLPRARPPRRCRPPPPRCASGRTSTR